MMTGDGDGGGGGDVGVTRGEIDVEGFVIESCWNGQMNSTPSTQVTFISSISSPSPQVEDDERFVELFHGIMTQLRSLVEI